VRFHQLSAGARFEYNGVIYRKISPLKGKSESDDTQKLIPRSAEVALVDDRGQPVIEQLPESLASDRVASELEKFVAACDLAATYLDPPLTESQRAQYQLAIRAAAQDLLTRLALCG